MNSIEINATQINDKHIIIWCPFCRSSYYKNGNPRWNANVIAHLFGSNGDTSNRIEYRISQCDKGSNQFKIIIDDNTKRF